MTNIIVICYHNIVKYHHFGTYIYKQFNNFINNRKDWVLVDIYADEAITGTQTKKRNDFQRLINDCMNGEIDMVITKSISRFARNTLDTLNYVRMLKEKNVAVFFEEENISQKEQTNTFLSI